MHDQGHSVNYDIKEAQDLHNVILYASQYLLK